MKKPIIRCDNCDAREYTKAAINRKCFFCDIGIMRDMSIVDIYNKEEE